MLQKTLLITALSLTVSVFSHTANAAHPCEVVLCMYGKAVGSSGGNECKDIENVFFNIVNKKKGLTCWDKTFDARKFFLNQCTSADPTAIAMIMSKFGKVTG